MKELQHLLNKVNKVTAYHRHGNKIPATALDALSNAQIEYEKVVKKKKPVCCANCRYFVSLDIAKELQDICTNEDIMEVAWVENPNAWGCTFYEEKVEGKI